MQDVIETSSLNTLGSMTLSLQPCAGRPVWSAQMVVEDCRWLQNCPTTSAPTPVHSKLCKYVVNALRDATETLLTAKLACIRESVMFPSVSVLKTEQMAFSACQCGS